MYYAQIIEMLHPGVEIDFETDVRLSYNGQTFSIDHWDTVKLGPQPELADLDEHEAEYLLELARATKLQALFDEYTNQVSLVDSVSLTNPANRRRHNIILRKAIRTTLTAGEEVELETFDAVDTHLDTLDSELDIADVYLNDNIRTLSELENYNVTVDPNWSTYIPA